MSSISIKHCLSTFELDVCIQVQSSKVSALYGPSGSGKSSILELITGISGDAGQKIIEGVLEKRLDSSAFRDKGIGYLPQDLLLFPHLSLEQNILFCVRNQAVDIDQLIDVFELSHLMEKHPEQLSGGEKQRCALARAILSAETLLLLDEPLTGVERRLKQKIIQYLRHMFRQCDLPVVLVSHDTELVGLLSDQVNFIQQGKLVYSGNINDLFFQEALGGAFLEEEIESVFECSYRGFNQEENLVTLVFGANEFYITSETALEFPDVCRVLVHAKDVSICLERSKETSILNIFPARVEKLTSMGDSKVFVSLLIEGKYRLSSLISKKSAKDLCLIEGSQVFAQVKSVGLVA